MFNVVCVKSSFVGTINACVFSWWFILLLPLCYLGCSLETAPVCWPFSVSLLPTDWLAMSNTSMCVCVCVCVFERVCVWLRKKKRLLFQLPAYIKYLPSYCHGQTVRPTFQCKIARVHRHTHTHSHIYKSTLLSRKCFRLCNAGSTTGHAFGRPPIHSD